MNDVISLAGQTHRLEPRSWNIPSKSPDGDRKDWTLNLFYLMARVLNSHIHKIDFRKLADFLDQNARCFIYPQEMKDYSESDFAVFKDSLLMLLK